ncbi:DUF4839 domain-containing protein [Gordonia rubripertincta]|uniref:DUF4839 domain-containing protein n=1 Tax=Gordonia rubripertincta TaxID=36822 RepID=A0AAW4GCJ2_GORRU|nr:DUF4839 domain-containing protein [Gordonia rubripertincta]MBM7280651.1 DUF4839 domain-containing protein [Gordonia rubripertincta]
MDAEVTYETKTIRAVRGMESRTIRKWEADGWEFVSQSPGKVQAEITFRRPKPKSRRLLWIVGGAVLVLVLAIFIVVGVVSERNAAPADSANAAPSKTTAEPSRQSSSDATSSAPSRSSNPDDVVLTPENSPELAAVLALTDYCSPRIAAFAAAHSGQTIEFPGSIGAMALHGDAKTRYDIHINAGDDASAPGPAFQFRDENTINDLHWVGPVPATIGVGTNLSITAEVDRYEEQSCRFLLEPVATSIR